MNVKELVDHIYSNSCLPNLMRIKPVENPHVQVIEDIEFKQPTEFNEFRYDSLAEPYYYTTKVNYIALDNYIVNASIHDSHLKQLENKYDFTALYTNKAFLDVLVSEAFKSLDRIFLEYVEKHSKTEYLSLTNIKSKMAQKYSQKNKRFSFFNRERIDPQEFFMNVLMKHCINSEEGFGLNNYNYIIVSPNLANFISRSIFFTPTRGKRVPHIHEFGQLRITHDQRRSDFGIPGIPYYVKVFVNPNIEGTNLYFSKFDQNFVTFYYSTEDSLQEFIDINGMRTYRLLMYNKIYDTTNSMEFKKIIFDDDNN